MRKKPGKQINPIRKRLFKKSLLKGESIKQSLLDAGYTAGTAHKSSHNSVVKVCQAEIERDVKKQITVEYVLDELMRAKQMAEEKQDIASYTRVCELLGKYLAMFTEKIKSTSEVTLKSDEENEYQRLRNNRVENVFPSEN
jgi:hypothetical protein